MKKLAACLMLAAFLWPAAPAQAFFRGVLEKQQDIVVTVEGPDTAVTVLALGPRGRLAVIGILTARAGSPALGTFVLGPLVERIVIEIDPPLNGTAQLTLDQGAKRIEDLVDVTEDRRFVYDVLP
jgi:hypothetical protein